MHVFLSDSFLGRLSLSWKPDLNAFLLGQRNLFFFTPEFAVQTEQLDPGSVNEFLRKCSESNLQLLGFLSPAPLSFVPGFLYLETGGDQDVRKWVARVCMMSESGSESVHPVEIRSSGATMVSL